MHLHIRNGFLAFRDGPPIGKRFTQWLMRHGDMGTAIPGIEPATFVGDNFWPQPAAGAIVGPTTERLDAIIKENSIVDWFNDAGNAALRAVGQLVVADDDCLGLIPARGSRMNPDDGAIVAPALLDADQQAALKTVIDGLGPGRWGLVYQITLLVEPYLTRRPVMMEELDIKVLD